MTINISAMKTLLLTAIVLSLTISGYSQERKSRIYTYKKQFISEKLELNGQQKREFWPMYDDYNRSLKDLRIEMSQNKLGLRKSSISDLEAKNIIQTNLDIKQKILLLEKEYFVKYSNILSTKQLIELIKAEDDFNTIMLERIKERKRSYATPEDKNL